jgi:c-di-GMP phosphodiesterase
MTEHPAFGQVALGYSPLIDQSRAVIAPRLTVFPLRADAPPSATDLLAALELAFPADSGNVLLNLAHEGLLHDFMLCHPPAHMMVEVPAFMATQPEHSAGLLELQAAGSTLLLRGRPLGELPRELLGCFKHSIIDFDQDRRMGAPAPEGVTRKISHMQSGVRSVAQLEESFKRGAIAVLGWPMEVPLISGATKGQAAPALQVVVELINRVDRGEPIERLEAVLTTDPTLAFRLLRYINSPAFGLRVEVSSFRHAIMMLGYQKLKRWLALLLATASKDSNLRPVMYAAVRRGMFMEELGRSSGNEETRSELFLCGVFSLLDRMMGQPFAEMLKSIPVPEHVKAALVDVQGPYVPYLAVLEAVEQESLIDIREAADNLMLTVPEVNRGLLRALAGARQLA